MYVTLLLQYCKVDKVVQIFDSGPFSSFLSSVQRKELDEEIIFVFSRRLSLVVRCTSTRLGGGGGCFRGEHSIVTVTGQTWDQLLSKKENLNYANQLFKLTKRLVLDRQRFSL